MEDILTCFIKLKTIKGDLETPWICQEGSSSRKSSSKIFWLGTENEDIKDFIQQIKRRQISKKVRKFGYQFNLITEGFVLYHCSLDFNFRQYKKDGVFIKFVDRRDKV